ncbi:MAG: hypothetical protein WCD89_22590 [Anaerocolumna sp.]
MSNEQDGICPECTGKLQYRAGCNHEFFTEKAVDEIFRSSSGTMRVINRICEKCLMYAFQQQKKLVDDHMVRYVVEHEMLGGA